MAVLLINRVLLVGCLSILHYVTQVQVVVAMENRPDKGGFPPSKDVRWSSAFRDNGIDPFLGTPSEFQHISPKHSKERQRAESSAALEYDIGENGVTAIIQARPQVSSTRSDTHLQESDTSSKSSTLDFSEYIDFPEDIVDSDMAANSRGSQSNRINTPDEFFSELKNYLAEYYPVVEVDEVLTAKTIQSEGTKTLFRYYQRGHFPEIENLVNEFLEGPSLSDLGEQFPSSALNSWIQQEFMPDLSSACYRQLSLPQHQQDSRSIETLISTEVVRILQITYRHRTTYGASGLIRGLMTIGYPIFPAICNNNCASPPGGASCSHALASGPRATVITAEFDF
ncbi:hypothetical protein IWQ62_001071 [Dispira parvispora]|uniref:Uncharacterized protein n=1 Tax=Dispira parvispora TaxID=1520584 RepID=A0A9W8AZ93_9FUNG|nr:hypothetical protein IWQ62_001071 [Dispira parvispora]